MTSWGQGGGGGYGPPPGGGGYGPPPGYGHGYAPIAQPPPSGVGIPRCQHCGYQGRMAFTSKISTGGWIVFALLLIACFPLCWIGLTMKTTAQQCPQCLNALGQHI